MAYFQAASVVVPVRRDSARQSTPDIGGESFRAFAGNLRSTRRWVKRQWEMTTIPMTFADITTLLTAIGTPAGGNYVSCTGTFNNGVAITCQVVVTGREDAKESNTVIRQRLTLQVSEV